MHRVSARTALAELLDPRESLVHIILETEDSVVGLRADSHVQTRAASNSTRLLKLKTQWMGLTELVIRRGFSTFGIVIRREVCF